MAGSIEQQLPKTGFKIGCLQVTWRVAFFLKNKILGPILGNSHSESIRAYQNLYSDSRFCSPSDFEMQPSLGMYSIE